MFEGFMYQNRVLKCNLIMEFKDIYYNPERESCLQISFFLPYFNMATSLSGSGK